MYEVINGVRQFPQDVSQTALLSNAQIIGSAFYVDRHHTNASDDNAGTDPEYPLLKIQVAWDKCTDLKNDYVFCINTRLEDTAAITGTVTTAHLIGMPQTGYFSVNNIPRANSDYSLFVFPTAAIRTEIAGFNMNGGNTHGAIETSGSPSALWIHHNVFGSEYAGSATPKYGIYSSHAPTGLEYALIEDNWFFGASGEASSPGKIDDTAMLMYGAKGTVIRRNTFIGIPGVAIDITETTAMSILDNSFQILDAETGEAITLRVSCLDLLIKGNVTGEGMLNSGYTYNPYRDLCSNDKNAWTMNYRGNSVIEPVGV